MIAGIRKIYSKVGPCPCVLDYIASQAYFSLEILTKPLSCGALVFRYM